jgi:UDP-glucose 4-epimerase
MHRLKAVKNAMQNLAGVTMNWKKKQRVAVVGAGFIGKSLIRKLLAKGVEVSVLDRNICPDEFSATVKWISGNCHDGDSLDQALQGVSVAYHLISSTVPGDQHVDVAMELNENVVGTFHFLNACLRCGVKRIVFASSASVYGIQSDLPIKESATTNPISAHGIHKLTVEKFLLLGRHLHGIEVQLLRIGNPYGPEQSLMGRQGFIAIAIGDICRGVPVAMRGEGKAIRDFIFIDDLAEAMALAGFLDNLPPVINIGTGIGSSLREVLDMMEQIIGRSVETISSDSRVVDIPASVMDIGLAKSRMNFMPVIGLRSGVSMTLRAHGF